MKPVRWIPLLVMVIASFFAGAATPPDQVPPPFAGLVPAGCREVSPGFTRGSVGDADMRITNVGVEFVAYKPVKTQNVAYKEATYSFDLIVMEEPALLIRSQGKYYPVQRDRDIQSTRENYASNKSGAFTGYDPPKETRYAWGWGITQRRLNHWVGAGTRPDYVDYQGHYIGLIMSDTTIKSFKLDVFGAKSSEEADQWAKQCADKIEKTAVADIQ
jgi:hypothetical protein